MADAKLLIDKVKVTPIFCLGIGRIPDNTTAMTEIGDYATNRVSIMRFTLVLMKLLSHNQFNETSATKDGEIGL